VSLATLDVLVDVVTVRSSSLLGGLYALGVHDGRRCVGVLATRFIPIRSDLLSGMGLSIMAVVLILGY
jgi:hypothetical protein